MKVNVYKDGKLTKSWEADTYEYIYECGYEVIYVEKDGVRNKACVVGDFGNGCWSYDIER